MLYFHGHEHSYTAAKDFDGSDAIMEELGKAIHDGRLRDGWVDPKLMQWTGDKLLQAVLGESLIGDEEKQPMGQGFQGFMRNNVLVFSGFKTYQTLRAATNELLDEDGQVRPWEQFRDRILAIDQEYNKRYLRAEYDYGVAAGQMAERWQDIERDKEAFPFLEFQTVGDDRVRQAHDALNGIRKPVEDPFWDTHYPPLDWGCRCDVDQVSEGNGKNLPEVMPVVPQMFRANVGKTGVVFPESHPYYNAPQRARRAAESEAKKMLKQGAALVEPVGPRPSQGITLEVEGAQRQQAQRVLQAMDAVHGLPTRLEVSIMPGPVPAEYKYGLFSGTKIYVDWTDRAVLQHLAHELGHAVDHIGVPRSGRMYQYESMFAGRLSSGLMAPLFRRLESSAAIRATRAASEYDYVARFRGRQIPLQQMERERVEYLLNPEEMWARAYAQYIALRSGDAEIMLQLMEFSERMRIFDVRQQWAAKDFEPIATEMDKLFKKLKWQRHRKS